jgi:hypothetical protein
VKYRDKLRSGSPGWKCEVFFNDLFAGVNVWIGEWKSLVQTTCFRMGGERNTLSQDVRT